MRELKVLFENNRQWAESRLAQDPEYFARMAIDQRPKYLWIGCADSRIPPSQVVGLQPGEIFEHRNVGNLFIHTDFNCLSVLQYAVDFLEVKHVIVCGHYGCGGVLASMGNRQLGLVDNWLRNIRDVYAREKPELDAIQDMEARGKRLIEFNVLHQVLNVCHTTIVQNAWARQQPLWVHGWVYDIEKGLIRDLNCCVSNLAQIEDVYITQHLHY